MKNIFNALAGLSLSVLLFAACNVENITATYEPVEKSEVAFSQSTITATALDAKSTSFVIELVRSTGNDAITVPISATLPTGITGPESVSFAAGDYTAALTLDISAMVVGKNYKGTIALTDSTTFNPNLAIAKASFTLAKAYTWVSLGKGQWFDHLALMSDDSFGIANVEVLKADGFDRYRIMAPYADKKQLAAAWGEESIGDPTSAYIEYWVNEDKTVAWDTKWNPGLINDGPINAYLPSAFGAKYAAQDALSKYVEEKVIRFCPFWYIDNVGGWGAGKYVCYLSLPGGPDLNEWLAE